MDVRASDTIDKIMEACDLMTDVKVMAPLQSGRTLSDYDIQNGSTLFLVRTSFPITIKPQEGSSFKLYLHPSDTIGMVKQMIEPRTTKIGLPLGIPPDLQRLRFDGVELENERKIIHLPINQFSILRLRWSNLDLERRSFVDIVGPNANA